MTEIRKSELLLNEQKSKAINILNLIYKDYKSSMVDPSNLEDLRNCLKSARKQKIESPIFNDLITLEYLQFFRKLLLEEKTVRSITLKLLRYNIEIYPQFTKKLIAKMFPIAICKIFEEFKHGSFDERFECFKLIYSWLKFSNKNFPLIFCQAIASMAKTDEFFKKGCIEFLRNLAIKKPEFCSSVGGFRILITSLIDESCLDISDNIFFTLLYVINTPSKRKFFDGFADFYKIFAIFTKSDFTIQDKDKPEEPSGDERSKLDVQLELSKRIIEKLLKTWPGYSLIMGDYRAMRSIIQSLNTDTSLTIKKNVINMVKEIIESEFIVIDNFTTLCSPSKDMFYINKIYLAYILQGLQNNKLYESLMKFIEKENNPLSEDAQKIALKFTILYSKLSNADLQLPFLNEQIEQQKQSEQLNLQKNIPNEHEAKGTDEEIVNTKMRVMHLLDQTFYHFNCKDYANMELSDLSYEVIKAMNTVVNMQNNKKYNNQYSIESSKKELYLIDDDSFQQILKNSKILDSKEFKTWDWKHMDEILDIIQNKTELIMDIFKQKYFKRLLFCFMPSKNQFVKLTWMPENFIYASIGTKLFKLLSNNSQAISILEQPPEDYIFSKSLSWYDDVHQCLENLLNNIYEKDQPFSIKRVYRTMSKQIFTFLGVLSQSTLGEDYLVKKGFYKLIAKFALSNYNFDYILTNLIDNLNFNSKNVIAFIQQLLEKGSKKIKRYIFEHILCLLKFGKDVIWNINDIINSLENDTDVNKVIISILTSLVLEGRYMDEFSDMSNIQKINAVNKNIFYLLMRGRDLYNRLNDLIDEEVKNINMKDIVEKFGNDLEENMNEIFNYEDLRQDNYYLSVNLPRIESQYDNYTEIFWLKQLPFNVNMIIADAHNSKEIYVFNTYLEYHDEKKLCIYGKPQGISDLIINQDQHQIKFVMFLGEQSIDNKCKALSYSNSLTFEKSDLEQMTSIGKNNETFYKAEKDGVVIEFTKSRNSQPSEYHIYQVYFAVKVRPEKKQPLKTPVNILTELANNEEGMQKLIDLKAIEFLFEYLDNPQSSVKDVKSALWILAKIATKETFGTMLQERYNIINRILQYNSQCEDYAMKGTICYIMCYLSQNKTLKGIIGETHEFFFNTDICYPKKMDELYIKTRVMYENKKIKDDGEKINKYIKLNDKSEKIFANVSSLLNTISYKQAYDKLNDMAKADSKAFNDPNLLVKVYMLLSRYKFRQQLRRFIMLLFEGALSSPDVVDAAVKTMESLSKELFESTESFEEENRKVSQGMREV